MAIQGAGALARTQGDNSAPLAMLPRSDGPPPSERWLVNGVVSVYPLRLQGQPLGSG